MKRLLLCVALVACKDKDAAPAAKPASGEVAQPAPAPQGRAQKPIVVPKARRPDAPPAKLVIEPTKINIVSASEKELAIDASGKVIAAGKEVGTITADGKLLKSDGTVLASLDEDGTVNFAGNPGNDKVIQIDPDGAVQVDGRRCCASTRRAASRSATRRASSRTTASPCSKAHRRRAAGSRSCS